MPQFCRDGTVFATADCSWIPNAWKRSPEIRPALSTNSPSANLASAPAPCWMRLATPQTSRPLFAGLDYDAWCEWDLELWFDQGELSPQVTALRTLLSPELWTPESKDAEAPLLQAIRDTRKGQAELSEVLGERVREAVELLIQGHGEALKERCGTVDPADIYRGACRVTMRLVVILLPSLGNFCPVTTPSITRATS